MSESSIVNFVYIFIIKTIDLYKHSKTRNLFDLISRNLKGYFSHSFIWNKIKANEKTSVIFQNSLLYILVQGLLDKFLNILRKLYSLIKLSFENSIIGRILDKLLAHFIIIICLFIFIHTVVPYHLWHNQYSIILIFGITLLYLVKAAMDSRYGLNFKKLDFAFVLYILTIFLAAFTSITPLISMKTLLFNIVLFLFVFIMVNAVKTKEELGTILYWIIAAITFTCFYGIWQYINHVPIDPRLVDINTFGAGVSRVYSTMGNPNDYAEYIVLTLPFFAAAFFNSKNIIVKLAVSGLSLLALFNLAVSGSRSGLLGLIAAAIIYVFLKNRKLIPVLILLGIIMIPFIPNSIIVRMQTIGKDSSSVLRLDIWKGSLGMLKDFWVTGVGIGPQPFRKLFNLYSQILKPAHSHMLPLQIWLELGFVGIASFVWFLTRIIKKGIISIFQKSDTYLNNIIIANIASITGIITIGLVEYVWFNPRILNMFWMNIGIFLIALNLIGRKPAQNS